jgi:hypothetical protein
MVRIASSIVLVASLTALGCANKGGSSGTAAAPAQQSAPAQQAPAQKAAPAQPAPPAKGVPPPAGSKLSKVQKDMSPEQVRQILGPPTSEKSYVTAKRFIPYYYGADAGTNTEWAYKGIGRVVFGVNKYSGTTRVIRIDHDPSEDGQ